MTLDPVADAKTIAIFDPALAGGMPAALHQTIPLMSKYKITIDKNRCGFNAVHDGSAGYFALDEEHQAHVIAPRRR
ncbi:MAG: hypothetical protein IPP40_18530 [bacterium]|nr:hypothetical protein [bacterium]